MRNILIAGLVHETHTFLKEETTLSDFEELIWLKGQEMVNYCRGDLSPMSGMLEVADRFGWHIFASTYGVAMPSGIVDDDVLEIWWDEVSIDIDSAQPIGLDGVLLVLHGAMVCNSFSDVEGEILRRIREKVGGIPISADLDLHANFSQQMAKKGTIFTGYRENPHTDARAAGERAAVLLEGVLNLECTPKVVCIKPGALYAPVGTATDNEPMRNFESQARTLEENHPELLEVCVLPGFAYADVACAGFSIVVTTIGDPSDAYNLISSLASEVLKFVDKGNPLEPPIEEIMPFARQYFDGPIGLIEPSDNIGGGTPGDGTGVLQSFIKHEIDNAAVVINDPDAVSKCFAVSIGDGLRIEVGGKVDQAHGPTLLLDVIVDNLTDGRFELENPQSHLASLVGRRVDMGPCAVVRFKGIRILLTSKKTPPMDLGQLRSQGIIPESLYMIGIKAAVSHKAAYDSILKESYFVDTPGLGSSDLCKFSFSNIPRPIGPLDLVSS
jgi:microcystin degradation protein MlrC